MRWKRNVGVLCLLCMAALPACAQRPTVPMDEVKEATPMSQPSTNAATQITAEELFSRLFKLAAALREPADLAQAQVEARLGIDLIPDPDYKRQTYYEGSVAEGWKYLITYEVQRDGAPDVRLHFADEGMHQGRCAADLERLATGFIKANYKRRGPTYPPGRRFWSFSTDVAEANTGFGFQLFTTFDSENIEIRRECVVFLTIGYEGINDD